uniref:Reverse transcriptase zinc-binding domain-containing protein n=1 Tax=Latimeria chalumnae TaxID=7897 RepID=H3ALW6_LATCH
AIWSSRGICLVSQLYPSGIVIFFSELRDQYDIPKTQFYYYLQIRNVFFKVIGKEMALPQKVMDTKLGRGLLSKLYSVINNVDKGVLEPTQRAWHKELEVELSSEQWKQIWKSTQNISNCVRLKTIQLKIIHRYHLYPLKMWKMHLLSSSNCWRCGEQDGSLLHMFWHCKSINNFWKGVVKMLSELLDILIEASPTLCVLNLKPEEGISKAQFRLLSVGLLTTRRLILTNWKGTPVFSLKSWLELYLDTINMEKPGASILSNVNRERETWDLTSYILSKNLFFEERD